MPIETLETGRLTWTNITQATPDDIQRLGQQHPAFHPLDLEDCLSRIERPKIDEYEQYMFIVMQFPVWDNKQRVSRLGEVDFFVGPGFLVTVHDGDLKPLNDLFEQCHTLKEAQQQHMSKGAGQLLHLIIDRLVDYIFPILYKVDGNIRSIEDTMFDENTKQTIQEISLVRRDIIALRRIIRPQTAIVHNLEQIDRPYIKDELDVYFGDTLDHLQKARDIIEDDAEVIAGLAGTIDALSSHRINEVMRVLTVVSFVLLPLEVIVGFMGMNIALPLTNSLYAYIIILGIMAAIAAGMFIFFKKKHWL